MPQSLPIRGFLSPVLFARFSLFLELIPVGPSVFPPVFPVCCTFSLLNHLTAGFNHLLTGQKMLEIIVVFLK